MFCQKWLQLMVVIVAMLFLVSCSAPVAAPVAEAPPATATPIPPPTPPPTPLPQPTKPVVQAIGELRFEKIASQALRGNLVGDSTMRRYVVYLPPGYADGNKRYPVVYILHGATGDEGSFLFLKVDYEDILREGTAQEMILVFPDGNNRFRASNYISSPTIGDYETYIARELVAQIDANYRTIPHRDSRGITGCSMGGDGSIHLALTFPDVFSVAVPMSATYDFANDPTIPEAAADFTHVPKDFNDLNRYWDVGVGNTAFYISLAAGAAPNPDKPPFYLDLPFEVVDGKGRIVPEVWEKIAAVDEVHDLEEYLQQPIRLHHILLMHGEYEEEAPVELARSFDRLLTARGVDHKYLEFKSGHCAYDMTPALQYLSDHLSAEQPSISEAVDATATPPSQPAQPTPLTRNLLTRIWGSSSRDVFAVGLAGTILHYDGTAWLPQKSGIDYALIAVWGSSDRDVFAVGENGTILHYGGEAWSPMDSGTRFGLWGVWGNSDNDVFAFGDAGLLLHYDGKTWSPVDSSTTNLLVTGWGSSNKDIFVVGWGGTIVHYDGRAWSRMKSETQRSLWGVWGSSGRDVFAVGSGGTIMHYDGNVWSLMNSGTTKELNFVWGSSDHDVFAVGDGGTILHYDGKAWSPMNNGTTKGFDAVWGSSGSDVFAVGDDGTILHYDGKVWADMSSGARG